VRVLPPVEPRNLLQSGANYRKHVIDIIVSEHDPADGRSAGEVRADAEAFMEHRATSTDPYLFIGLPSAMCGAFDDIVLPADGTEHDWELELAVVIGRRAATAPAGGGSCAPGTASTPRSPGSAGSAIAA
jgi:2-keto-4-pentenoate hydratase/2-oxohepta-3-ene-1,7-dioic acid hydratase in catechol pathway